MCDLGVDILLERMTTQDRELWQAMKPDLLETAISILSCLHSMGHLLLSDFSVPS